MVGWYDPRQLIRSAVEVAISTLFGRHSDRRLVEALAAGTNPQFFFDYTHHHEDKGDHCEPTNRPRTNIWIDYVADVGDGWNSTYEIARRLAAPTLDVAFKDSNGNVKGVYATQRGALLILGGDEVYPSASRKEYERRLIVPYETALPAVTGEAPHAFFVPGNHDWYDSLVAFTRLFTSGRRFASWRTRQERSYFALKLPHNWWLIGTDMQLGADLDGPQAKYFERLAKEMEAEEERTHKRAQVIICHAEPHWINAAVYAKMDPEYDESNLQLLENRLGKNATVFIAGDLHHYRRHEKVDGSVQKITAGGGGAFLHPTHSGIRGVKLDKIKGPGDDVFMSKGTFPPEDASKRLCWRNLRFAYTRANWTFLLATGSLYFLQALTVLGTLTRYPPDVHWSTVVATSLDTLLRSEPTIAFALLTWAGFLLFTDTHSKPYRLVMGSLHALSHIFTAFLVAIAVVSVVAPRFPAEAWSISRTFGGITFVADGRLPLVAVLQFVLGGMVGAFLMGIYLLLSLNYFGRHNNEAFSSLAIEDWKSFLRLHINEAGELRIYPIGIRRVPKAWKPREGEHGPGLVPADSGGTEPELIEPPIRMPAIPSGIPS